MELFSLVGCPLFAGVPEGEWGKPAVSGGGQGAAPFSGERPCSPRGERTQSMGVVLRRPGGRWRHHDFLGEQERAGQPGAGGKSSPRLMPCSPRNPCRLASPGRRRGEPYSCPRESWGKTPGCSGTCCWLTAEKKPAALPADLPHLLQDHPGPGAFLSLLRGGEKRLPGVYHPLYPAAAGGLLGGGPQRLVPRAGEHGPGGAAAHPPGPGLPCW